MTSSFAKIHKEILPELLKHVGSQNILAAPKIAKVIVHVSVGRLVVGQGEKTLEPYEKDLLRICGQKPARRPAKKSISAFKVRQGMPVGLMVTLRGKRAQDFFSRLILVALPRLRDFRGIDQKAVDQNGNLTIGIREQTAFPEAANEPTGTVFGLEVTVVTKAKNREHALGLFKLLRVPFKAQDQV